MWAGDSIQSQGLQPAIRSNRKDCSFHVTPKLGYGGFSDS